MKATNIYQLKEGDGDMPRSLLSVSDPDDGSEKNLQLLPGLPDEITVRHIATKLHWKDVYNLSSVSQLWSATIKGREIFQARLSSHSTQTLFAFQGHMPKIGFFSDPVPRAEFFLYSPEDNSCYQLPPIPDLDIQPSDLDFGADCECVFLEGKLYVFGGASRLSKLDRSNVFVYDFVRQKGWKACAPMQPRMVNFQCALIHRKIYVFGGVKVRRRKGFAKIIYDEFDFGYTVYDAAQDSWSSLTFDASKPNIRKLNQRMISMGEKLVVYQGPSGEVDIPHNLDAPGRFSAEIYSPATGEWKIVEDIRSDDSDLIISIDDRIHRLYRPDVDMYAPNTADMETRIHYDDMYFCDGAVVDDVLYLLESRRFHVEVLGKLDSDDEEDRTVERGRKIELIAISGWKEHVTFEVDGHGEIEVIGTMISELREIDCCLPEEERLVDFFRCPVRL